MVGRKRNNTFLFTLNNPQSPVSESFRMLRTNIYFSFKEKSRVNMMITSAVSGEGKSTITVNLGIVMAEAGRDVLIIDSDLRNPVMHKYFSIDNSLGLTNLLVQDLDPDHVTHSTGIKGLSLIPGGPIPPNPSELLGSKKMENILEQASTQYDTVLLDVPPVISVTDAVVLAPRVDGVLMVVKSASTNKDLVQEAKKQLEMANARILGVVLNEIRARRNDYRYYYYFRSRRKAAGEIGVSAPQAAAAKDSSEQSS